MEENEEEQPLSKAFYLLREEAKEEDLRAINQAVNNLAAGVNLMQEQLSELIKKETKPNSIIQPSAQSTRNIDIDLLKIQSKLDRLSEQKRSRFQILLFPEQDRKLFYKIVFGRWLILLVAMLLLNNLYKFGVHQSNNRKDIQLQQLKNDRINRAWHLQYDRSSDKVKASMEKAYEDAGELQ
ncbi:hypothetical protein [Taibaiella koreensis]|uniref:hypothetical protein n=1 Tax=Taibaiella koreensis TaxID=1268548 RepID=UPI000E59A4A7|nr:hypothetical protein [Taibaiella koreensis]